METWRFTRAVHHFVRVNQSNCTIPKQTLNKAGYCVFVFKKKTQYTAGFLLVPVSSPSQDSKRLVAHKQTRLCKFFAIGACTKGTSCPFAHGVSHLRSLGKKHIRCRDRCFGETKTWLVIGTCNAILQYDTVHRCTYIGNYGSG